MCLPRHARLAKKSSVPVRSGHSGIADKLAISLNLFAGSLTCEPRLSLSRNLLGDAFFLDFTLFESRELTSSIRGSAEIRIPFARGIQHTSLLHLFLILT